VYAARTAACFSAWRWTTARREAGEFTAAELLAVAGRRNEMEETRNEKG
jgi:hypothetical protein